MREQGLGKSVSFISLSIENLPSPTAGDAEPVCCTIVVCIPHLPAKLRNGSRTGFIATIYRLSMHTADRRLRRKEYLKIDKKHPDYEARKQAKMDLPLRKARPGFRAYWYRTVLEGRRFRAIGHARVAIPLVSDGCPNLEQGGQYLLFVCDCSIQIRPELQGGAIPGRIFSAAPSTSPLMGSRSSSWRSASRSF